MMSIVIALLLLQLAPEPSEDRSLENYSYCLFSTIRDGFLAVEESPPPQQREAIFENARQSCVEEREKIIDWVMRILPNESPSNQIEFIAMMVNGADRILMEAAMDPGVDWSEAITWEGREGPSDAQD